MNPTTDESRPDASREYTLRNYQPYNSAVDQVVQQHILVTESLRASNRESLFRQALTLAAALSLIGLAIAFIYWLLLAQPASQFSNDVTPAPTEELTAISENNPSSTFGSLESFVQFTEKYTSTGEVVVTARKFDVDDLESPTYQWCYITTSTETMNSPDTELATLGDEGTVIVQTTDDRLLGEPLRLCNFITN